jgi:hypothetical protein
MKKCKLHLRRKEDHMFSSLDSIAEPREQTWPNPKSKTHIFAKIIIDFNSKKGYLKKEGPIWFGTPKWTLD